MRIIITSIIADPFALSGHKIARILKSNLSPNKNIIFNNIPFTDTYLVGFHPKSKDKTFVLYNL